MNALSFDEWVALHPDQELRNALQEWDQRRDDIVPYLLMRTTFDLYCQRQKSDFWRDWPV